MSQKYLAELVRIAQQEMPSLEYDIQNGSTHYALQAATQRLFNIVGYMLHNQIHSAYEGISTPAEVKVQAPVVQAPVVQPSVVRAPVFMTVPVVSPGVPMGMPVLPPPSIITQPTVSSPSSPDMPEVPSTPGVANVIITAQGTKVISPSGATTMVPPGEAVGLEATASAPPMPFSEPGVQTVVLAPGGGLSPDVAAALASRSGQ